jgi:hypothetical protein
MLSSLARLSPVNVDVIPLSPVFVYILRNPFDVGGILLSLDEELYKLDKLIQRINY